MNSMYESMPRNERAARRRLCSQPLADGSMHFWRMEQLWELAAGLPVKKVRTKDLAGIDDVRWFGGPRKILPTCRAVAEHARDIFEADLSYPIILSATGDVLDGMHRLCKAFVQGIEEIDAVQLPEELPEPRWRVLANGAEVETQPPSSRDTMNSPYTETDDGAATAPSTVVAEKHGSRRLRTRVSGSRPPPSSTDGEKHGVVERMKLDIRTATEADAEAASALVVRSFCELAAADWDPAAVQVLLADAAP